MQGMAAPVAASDDIVSRMVERDITVDITPERESEILQKIVELDKEQSDLENEKKKVVSEFNEKIAKRALEIEKLIAEAREGQTTIFTMVKEVRDYNSCLAQSFIGPNFDQLVEERAMEGDELQKDLFLRKESESESLSDIEAQGDALMEEAKITDVRDVIREETNSRTKHSSVDGAING